MTAVCRGCAGTGIGQHVPPRTMAVLQSFGTRWFFVPVNPRRKGRTIYVGASSAAIYDEARHLGTRIPLADALLRIGALLGDGFRYSPETPIRPDPAWKCDWCYGTGTPQLSVGTLSVLSAGIAQMENQLAQITERRENHEAAQRARAEGRYP